MSTTDINIINVNGLDYPIKDQKARDIAESAVQIFAYYEDGLVASQAYSIIGTPICWKGELYYTIATVAKGEIWQVGTNLRTGDKAGLVVYKINDIESELTANGNRIYMDYQNGLYGYNTSANRGADTFHPFNSFTGTSVYSYMDTGDDGTRVLTYTAATAGFYMAIVTANVGDIQDYSGGTRRINYINGFSSTPVNLTINPFDATIRVVIGYVNAGTAISASVTTIGNRRSRGMTVFKFNS